LSDESESSPIIGPKIRKEMDTIRTMIKLYCEKKHDSSSGHLCPECTELLEYAYNRLRKCRFQEEKPTCRTCPVHCYRPTLRDEIKKVMRFSGPRLVFRAPLDWIRHRLHDRENGVEID
jgi:hypothetical protein